MKVEQVKTDVQFYCNRWTTLSSNQVVFIELFLTANLSKADMYRILLYDFRLHIFATIILLSHVNSSAASTQRFFFFFRRTNNI